MNEATVDRDKLEAQIRHYDKSAKGCTEAAKVCEEDISRQVAKRTAAYYRGKRDALREVLEDAH